MKKISFLLLILLLAGCNMPAAAPATPVPPTATIAARPSATKAPLNTPVLATPTARVVEATEPPIPPRIVILEPGPGSKMAYSIKVRGESDPTFEQGLGIQLTGDDGTILSETHTIINAEIGTRGPFEAELRFSIDREQPARLSVFDVGARDGGLLYLTSVVVTLWNTDLTTITTRENITDFFRIDQPAAFSEVSGGILHVEGMSGPAFENTILVTLCGEGGTGERELICGTQDNLLLTVPVMIQSPDVGLPGAFSVDLPYSVSQETFARVAVYVMSPMDGGVVELNSVEVILKP